MLRKVALLVAAVTLTMTAFADNPSTPANKTTQAKPPAPSHTGFAQVNSLQFGATNNSTIRKTPSKVPPTLVPVKNPAVVPPKK
jgi:hypothetical protein